MYGETAIRRATIDDADRVGNIFLEARNAAMSYLPEVHTDDQVRSWIAGTVLTNEDVFVETDDGDPVGFVALTESMLEHLYVQPRSWGHGSGSRLLEHAKQQRPDGFTLWVFQRNERARSFYERRGLVLVRTTDGDGNEEGEPDALYERPGEIHASS